MNKPRKRGDGLTACACSRPKNANTMRCQDCHQRRWTEAEDVRLGEMIAAGFSYKEMALELQRSLGGVHDRARRNGLRLNPEAAARNTKAGRQAFWSDAARVERWSAKHRRHNLSPETLERHRLTAIARIRSGDFGCKGHSKETRKKLSAVHLARADRRLSFAPRGHPLREEYRKLTLVFGKQEALRIILDEVGRLPDFEKQMLRVQAGATLSRKFEPPKTGYSYTLGGVAPEAI